jgi:cation:H+ antiporter
VNWLLLLGLGAIIVAGGRQLALYGDMLGEKTGLGRSWVGAVILAATTSLPELFAGVGASAVFQLPELAVGDVLGSCMFNLLILSLMDLVGGKTPLSARMSPGHALTIGFGCLLYGIVGIGLVAHSHLPVLGWISLTTPVIVVVYMLSMRISFRYERRQLAGQAEHLAEALQYADVPLRTVWVRYLGAAAVVVAAAVFLPQAGEAIAKETGLGQSFVGTLFIAIATSLPEIAVSITAVRMGSSDLAVGNVLGSNLFNAAILGFDDVLYRPGPILAAVGPEHLLAILGIVAMSGVVLVGLVYQATEKRLVLAWDTLGVAILYVATITLYLAK